MLVIAPVAGSVLLRAHFAKGESNLTAIERSYRNMEEWEARAATIRAGILHQGQLDPLPRRTALNATLHSERVLANYSVAAFAFESLPGFFVTGNLYRPAGGNQVPMPVVLVPHGHFPGGRFTAHNQYLAATLARAGACVATYDMVGWGESTQVVHETPHAFTLQLWNSMRVLDFLLDLPGTDQTRVAVTGASGGGTQAFMLTAVDARVTVSVPVVMVSSWFYGGCACESGLPVHAGPGYRTNNAEIAALAAPRPQLVISDGDDWTWTVPTVEYPFLQSVYALHGARDRVTNAHFPAEGHDYGPSKRNATYHFLARYLNLSLAAVTGPAGQVDETGIPILSPSDLAAFTAAHPRPAWALAGVSAVMAQVRLLQAPVVASVGIIHSRTG